MGKTYRAAMAVLVMIALAAPSAAQSQTAPRQTRLVMGLGNTGSAAVQRLGERLPQLAAGLGVSPEFLSKSFLTLTTQFKLFLDDEGHLAIMDGSVGYDTTPIPFTEGLRFDKGQTFALNSKPNSSRTIALIFRGYDPTNTRFEKVAGTPHFPEYSIDNSPSFSDEEHARIQDIWARVAEDFAPFDVNVTTEQVSPDRLSRSGPEDRVYGAPVVITSEIETVLRASFNKAGGYINSFDKFDDRRKPIIVYSRVLGRGHPTPIADMISHMIGHSLGLLDDVELEFDIDRQVYDLTQTGRVTGADFSVAPIMGSSYGADVTQFSNGQYPGALNQQDDIAVMIRNGLPLRTDDHGTLRTTASPLNVTPAAVATQGVDSFMTAMTAAVEPSVPPQRITASHQGVVERMNDHDLFYINAGVGELNVEVQSISSAPNINLALYLFTANAVQIAIDNPSNSLGASFRYDIRQPGGYFIKVVPAAAAGVPAYGNRGAYHLTADFAAPVTEPPVAAFSATTSSSGLRTLSFDASASQDDRGIAKYTWNFGDTSQQVETNVPTIHKTFPRPGTYTVSLRVTDSENFTAVTRQSITVANGQASITTPAIAVSTAASR